MSRRVFKFPLATLTRQAGRLQEALADGTYGPPVAARLATTFPAQFGAALTKVTGEPVAKAGQVGDTSTLTLAQDAAFHEMIRLMAAARRSAQLAFPGNNGVLHDEFKVGVHEPQDLGSEMERAGIIVASANKYATELGVHGWIAQDATDLQTAIATLGTVDLEQEAEKDEGPGMTAVATVDANALYRKCLSLQNAARLQFPSTKPGNETPRARYLIGEFPPPEHHEEPPATSTPASP